MSSLKYDCNVPDTMNFVGRFIHDIEVPVVAAINGIGQHYEFALMADVCICDPDFYFSDAHFSHNIVPGDGMNFSYPHVPGPEARLYMAYMEPKIDAKTALEWGLVDEVVPHDQLLDRAYEIANHIMKTGRAVRRLTHELVMRPWKRFFQDDERVRVLAEMYAVAACRPLATTSTRSPPTSPATARRPRSSTLGHLASSAPASHKPSAGRFALLDGPDSFRAVHR